MKSSDKRLETNRAFVAEGPMGQLCSLITLAPDAMLTEEDLAGRATTLWGLITVGLATPVQIPRAETKPGSGNAPKNSCTIVPLRRFASGNKE